MPVPSNDLQTTPCTPVPPGVSFQHATRSPSQREARQKQGKLISQALCFSALLGLRGRCQEQEPVMYSLIASNGGPICNPDLRTLHGALAMALWDLWLPKAVSSPWRASPPSLNLEASTFQHLSRRLGARSKKNSIQGSGNLGSRGSGFRSSVDRTSCSQRNRTPSGKRLFVITTTMIPYS